MQGTLPVLGLLRRLVVAVQQLQQVHHTGGFLLAFFRNFPPAVFLGF